MDVLDKLNYIFEDAKLNNLEFVFVGISAEGIREVIAIPTFSFEDKQKFYNNAYKEDGKHVMNSNVYIEFIANGNSDQLDVVYELWHKLDSGENDE